MNGENSERALRNEIRLTNERALGSERTVLAQPTPVEGGEGEGKSRQPLGRGIITDDIVKDGWSHGLFNEQVTNIDVLLYDFEVNESELLPRHKQVLDAVIEMIDPSKNVTSYMGGLSNFSRIVGRASQTGPEANNEELSQARADAVTEYLWRRASTHESRPETVGLGSSSPIRDRPNEEDAANRSVAFEFSLVETYLDMYSVDDADEWLRKWLEGARNAGSENEQVILRRRAKGQYLLARNYIDMVNQGHRNPPHGTPAWHVLLEWDSDRVPEQKSAEARIESAYEVASSQTAADMSAAYSLEGDLMNVKQNKEHRQRSRQDPYYRYTYGPVRKTVDGEERWVSVRAYVEQANSVERDVFGDEVEWLNDDWISD